VYAPELASNLLPYLVQLLGHLGIRQQQIKVSSTGKDQVGDRQGKLA
jgi:hypothetical protein